MSYKELGIGNPGTSIKFGSDDLDKVTKLLNGQVAGNPPVKIKSSSKWGFWDNTLFFRNPADTKQVTIRGPVVTNDLDLTLPPIVANDLLAALGIPQTFTDKQRFNLGVIFPQITTPAAPGSGLHNVYVGTNGHLMKTDNSLVTKDYDVTAQAVPIDVKDGSIASRMYDVLITKVGSTYYAVTGRGTVLSSGTNPNTVIQAGLNNGGEILIDANDNGVTDWQWDLQAGFTGFTFPAFTHIHIGKTLNLRVPNAAATYVFRITDQQQYITSEGCVIGEQGSPARNWTAVKIGTGTSADAIKYTHVSGIMVVDATAAIEIVQGSTGFINLVSIDDIRTVDCKKTIVWTSSSTTLISDVVISELKIDATPGITTDCFVNITGTRNQFFGNMLKDFSGSMSEMTITANAVSTQVFGGNHTGAVGTFTDSGTDTYIDDTVHTEWKLKGTPVSVTGIAADQNDYNPTGWNEKQNTLRLSSTVNINITGIVPGSNSKGRIIRVVNTGSFNITLVSGSGSSSALNRFNFGGDIVLIPNGQVTLFYDFTSGRWRASGAGVALLAVFNSFTALQEVKLDTSGALLQLYRPANTVTNGARLDFILNNASSVAKVYSRIRGEIVTNTAGAEDGKFVIQNMKGGSLFDTFTVDQLAKMILFRPTNAVNDNIDFTQEANDAVPNQTIYGRYRSTITDATNGSEDADVLIANMIAGTLTDQIRLGSSGVGIGKAGLFALLTDTDMSASRTIKFPNADNTLEGIVAMSGATNDINTTLAETDMLNYSVPANALRANGSVRVTISGYILQNQATGTTYTFAVKFGGTNLWADVSAAFAQSATKIPFRMEFEIWNKNATNAQACAGRIMIQDTTAATTGLGDVQDDEQTTVMNFDSEGADTAKDTTSAQTLQATITMSVSNAATHLVVKHTIVELFTRV